MSRSLEPLFRPRSIALLGASRRPGSLGAVLARNLFRSGFEGPILPVHPRHHSIAGVLTYRDVASLPMVPDLAVLATPADTVAPLLDELGRCGTRAAIVISSGFHPERATDTSRRSDLLRVIRKHGLRVLGPNTLGMLVPGLGLNASFSQRTPPPGRLAFVAQSGAIATAVLEWAAPREVGFSHVVSLGDMVDVDFADLLDLLAADPSTHSILLSIEAIPRARRFMSAARAASRARHVVVAKAGRWTESAAAARAHTGSDVGSDPVVDAALRRAGTLRVESLDELFGAVETLGHLVRPRGDRLAIVTNGGGMGVVATDDLLDCGGRLAQLDPATLDRLDDVLPALWSGANPVDIVGDAPGDRYEAALRPLLEDSGVDAILVICSPTGVSCPREAAEATIRAARGSRRPVLTCWLGDDDARRLLGSSGLPSYGSPRQAVRAFLHLVEYQRNQIALTETPPSVPEEFTADAARASLILQRALAEDRTRLDAGETKALLAAYGLELAPSAHPAQRALRITAWEDAQFGPVLAFQVTPESGTTSARRTIALPPLNLRLAHLAIDRSPAADLLSPEDREHLALSLVEVAQILIDHPGVVELVLDLAKPSGPLVDARIEVRPTDRTAAERLAIRPYPRELEEPVVLGDGRELLLRPVVPEDEPAFQETFAHLTPEEIRLRFHVPLQTLTHVAAARFTQLDYDREMALVLAEPGRPGKAPIHGVASIAADPDNREAEYSILIRSEMTGLGLGVFLMRRILDVARDRGIEEVWGDVLRENSTMRRLCRVLGFLEEPVPDDATLIRVRLHLVFESSPRPDEALVASS